MISKPSFRFTPQRKVILEVLQSLHTHPTADELYERVRKRLPKISLGTVYRNLDMLSSQGFVKKLYVAESQMRFDGNTDQHSHIHCLNCGLVSDIYPDFDLQQLSGDLNTDFQIQGYSLNFYGLCPQCHHTDPSNFKFSP